MTSKELLDRGQLAAAVDQAGQDVKAKPADLHLRTLLFELLCFAGQYDRAERQLEAIGHQSTTLEVGVQVYRSILTAERARQRLFTDGLRPDFLFDSPPYVQHHLQAVNRLREDRVSEAEELLEKAAETRDALPATVGGVACTGFRDGDDLLAPFLEVFLGSRYVWLPLDQVATVEIGAPKRLRDLLWVPATVTGRESPVGAVFLPALYPGSSEHPDDRIRLGRMTDWTTLGEGVVRGAGQRVFFDDEGEHAILELRDLRLGPVAAPTGEG